MPEATEDQCEAISNTGQRCRNRAVTRKLCATHAKYSWVLRIPKEPAAKPMVIALAVQEQPVAFIDVDEVVMYCVKCRRRIIILDSMAATYVCPCVKLRQPKGAVKAKRDVGGYGAEIGNTARFFNRPRRCYNCGTPIYPSDPDIVRKRGGYTIKRGRAVGRLAYFCDAFCYAQHVKWQENGIEPTPRINEQLFDGFRWMRGQRLYSTYAEDCDYYDMWCVPF